MSRNKNYYFRFKRFGVSHAISSIHVGVDAVLIGAWTRFPKSGEVLDVGTGCGVIALMAAQKTDDASILAIDVDSGSIEEARSNFNDSPWAPRLSAQLLDFSTCQSNFRGKFDLIVSNPPYFDSGVDADSSPRMKARHQSELSPFSLITTGKDYLTPGGALSMIFPFQFEKEVEKVAVESGLYIRRKCIVRGNPNSMPKRIMAEFSVGKGNESLPVICELVIEKEPGIFTEEYKALCREFYLKF